MDNRLQQALSTAITEATGTLFEISSIRSQGGGCINEAYVIGNGSAQFFVKLNVSSKYAMFEAEAEALAEIKSSNSIRAPEPVTHNIAGGQSYLILEALDFGSPKSSSWEKIGRELAQLHRSSSQCFGWHHHGFNIDQGEAAIGADDGNALERLAQYFLRAPISLQKMSWNAQTKTVLYRSSRSWRTKRNFELFSGTDFVAALYEHVPPKGFQTLRYYGIYSNKARGQRKQSGLKSHPSNLNPPLNSGLRPPLSGLRHRRRWRERIFDIWGCDPLKCPCCGSEMRPHKPVKDPDKIRRQLEGLGLWEPIILTKSCTPRAPPFTVRWILDAHDGTVIDLEPEASAAWLPTAPRSKRERAEPETQFSARTAAASTQVSSIKPHPSDPGLLLEIEDPEPWAQDNEPIFWTD